MKQSSIEILEKHKHHWFTLKNAGYINNLDYPVKLEIQSVIQAELDPHYHENLWCGECLTNMIRRIYTHYEKYLESQQVEVNPDLNKHTGKDYSPEKTAMAEKHAESAAEFIKEHQAKKKKK